MKVPAFVYRLSVATSLAFFAPLTLAQTCAARVQASNPTSAYVVDFSNNTVTDTRTGLMWDRCARGLSGPTCATGAYSGFTWQAALDAAATIGAYKGFNDWRLPNVKELRSLVEECRVAPNINEFSFPGTPPRFFWSSSPTVLGPGAAWGVFFDDGRTASDARSGVNQVRLVRAGQ